ncbi:cyclopropane fatty acyl phospholipid synthase [Legionella israelensis]|uniref:Cyclopropane fatty acyl phospholipid synthase n=1 Tax=Legionella israelensis TaxID=454 RepID=A0AAX1EDK2_9GAMM|nr:cyclopropane fatty acyl phospholipid synthase [Legionella israelensis]QBR83186.1 cyclopropane fatty acyl phospholipid synthase [Legionella israelensis]
MTRTSEKKFIESMLEHAGITINGNQPWDIQVHDENVYRRVLRQGELGLGEAYMENGWDCERLDVLITRLLEAKLDEKIKIPWHFFISYSMARLINFQGKTQSKQAIHHHYDLGNSLFKAMLDEKMMYSCAYFRNVSTLDEAQTAKLELVCQKLQLKPGMKVLDIGCGWGGLAKYMAEKFAVHVTGITLSEQQYQFAKENCKNLDVEIRLQDYRELNECFDRIVSIGMFEHVGPLNYRKFMEIVHRSLIEKGLFLLHTIGSNRSHFLSSQWIRKYIFPKGHLPSIQQIASASEPFFTMEDWHNFGADYDKTLMAWHDNFSHHWEALKKDYDERFYRMWTYFLLGSAACFRARSQQLWQIVFSKGGKPGGYLSIR